MALEIALTELKFILFGNHVCKNLCIYGLKIFSPVKCELSIFSAVASVLLSLFCLLKWPKRYFKCSNRKLFWVLINFELPEKHLDLNETSTNDEQYIVRIQSNIYRRPPENCLRQWDSLSCVLFNTALEIVVRRSDIGLNEQLLSHENDITVLGRSYVRVEEAIISLEESVKCVGLKVNGYNQNMRLYQYRTIEAYLYG